MHIIVTGATGAIGRATVPRLIAAGHTVTGLHHRPEGAAWLEAHGARPRQVDLFDPAQVAEVVDGADAAIHLATSIPPIDKMTKARNWAMNDRLRIEATDVLATAAERAGVPRLIVESISFNYLDGGDYWIDENHPVRPVFKATASALAAEQRAAAFSEAGGTGVALRFSQLYGPGSVSSGLVEALRSRRAPLVGAGSNYVSSIHVEDAGAAVLAALDAPAGVFNVSDDQPVRAAERMAIQVGAVGAPEPRRIPAGVARMLVGKATHQLTVSQRVFNRRFKDSTGWAPQYPSIKAGWQSATQPETRERTTR